MAHTRSQTWLDVALDAGSTFFQHQRDQLAIARAKRRAYRTTYRALARLSDRDLADLGIPRSHIRRLALEAANEL